MDFLTVRRILLLLACGLLLGSCGPIWEGVPDRTTVTKETKHRPEGRIKEKADAESPGSGEETEKEHREPDTGEPEEEAAGEEKTFTFVDVYQNSYEAEYDPEVPRSGYDKDLFMKVGSSMTYEGDRACSYRLGVDVSEFNGEIDWEKVKKAGMEFVFIRAGYRGYGSHPGLVEDKCFRKNLEGAEKAGLDIGLYFFSQALTPEEAREEADFLVKLLDGKKISLPLVCDLEHIEFDKARTDDLAPDQAAENVAAFCRRISELGYKPMFYSNLLWEAFGYELSELTEFPIWYADYEAKPQTPYYFSIWQYSNTGKVDGIPSNADLNIELISLS